MVSKSEVEKIFFRELGEGVVDLNASNIGRAHETFFVETRSGKYVLKTSNNEDRFQAEAPVMDFLSSETCVPVPGLIGCDNSKSEFAFMYFIAEFERGENICTFEADSGPKFKYLSVERKKSLLESAGRKLGLLHSQTCFESFGFFESRSNKLKFRDRGSWRNTFRSIIIEEQLDNFPDRFNDSKKLVKDFVDEHIAVLDEISSPCLIHQDFRWPNMKVQKDEVSAIFDWERAISGHHEYDLAKAEESLIQARSEKLKQKYRESLIKGYKESINLKEDWRQRIKFYKALRPVEAMWTFKGWTKEMEASKKDEMADLQRSRLRNRIKEYRNEFS